MREEINTLALKLGSTPIMVLRAAVALQLHQARQQQAEEGDPTSGETRLNVSGVEDDTASMFEPGYAEEIGVAPSSMREGAANDAGTAGEEDETLVSEVNTPPRAPS